MTKPARRARYLPAAAVALTVIAAPCAAFANSAGAYLNWNNKAQPVTNAPAQIEQVQTSTGTYPVPPSPYGEIGDPYARSLHWPAKQTPATPVIASISPPPQPDFAPVPAPPVRKPAPVSVSQPVPMSAPRPVTVVPMPQASVPQTPEPEDPGFADDPDLTPEAPIARQPVPKPVVRPLPVVASAPPPSHSETAPPSAAVASAMSTDGAYEVPTTSKYAARIAAARAAQLPAAEAPKGKPNAKSTATAPDPDVSLASQEADHIFIPGEQYKTPADEPRLYSLHRQYGMRPDPITITPGATGALLTVSPDVAEGGDPNDDDDKKSDNDKN